MSSNSFIKSTLGKKQLVGVTGIGLTLFVISHVLGNFLIFVGPEAYNKYSHTIVSNPFIYLIEAGLVVIFLVHLSTALRITLENHKARPDKYEYKAKGEKATSSVTKTMWIQGFIIGVYAVLHIYNIKYGAHYEVTYGDQTMRDIFRVIVEAFADPRVVVFYCIAVLILGFHVAHGFQSSIRTLGFNHPVYQPKIALVSKLIGAFIALGFMSQPIYVHLFL